MEVGNIFFRECILIWYTVETKMSVKYLNMEIKKLYTVVFFADVGMYDLISKLFILWLNELTIW
jgi:hypothetical protein